MTAFAAGDLFIVLPIITEEGKELLKELERIRSQRERPTVTRDSFFQSSN